MRRRRSSYGHRARRTALPDVLLPPSLPRFCRRRFLGGGRLLETLSHAAARAGMATPPSAGGAPPPLRVPSLATLQAPPLWNGVAFYWLTWGGGPTLANGGRKASAEAWERGRTPGSREWRSGGDLRGGSGRRRESPRGGGVGRGLPGFGPFYASHNLSRRVSTLRLKNNR